METITFKGKEYPARTLLMSDGVDKIERTISVQSLSDAMGDDKEKFDTEANNIDNGIYFYVMDDEINLSGEEICKNCLDEPFTFIPEEV
jgi:hypothetical protein